MALVMSYRSLRLHEEQGEALEQLATTVEVSTAQQPGSTVRRFKHAQLPAGLPCLLFHCI
jgi:hypothetical protein